MKTKEKIIEELGKEFKKGKLWDICLCWNDDEDTPLVFGSSIESIKDRLIDFIYQLLSQQKQKVMKEGIKAGLERAMDILNQYPEANVYEPRLDITQEIIKLKPHTITK